MKTRYARRRRSRRRAAVKWIVGILTLVAVPLMAAAGFRVFQVARDLRAAKTELQRVEQLLKAGRPTEARTALSIGAQRVTHANSIAYGSPELSVLNWIPVARQNLHAMRAAVKVALDLTSGGRRLLDTAQPLESRTGTFEVPMRTGAIPLPVIRALQPELRSLAGGLPTAREAPRSSFIVGPVRDLVRRVYEEADVRKRQVTSLSAACDLLAALSGANGPRRFMIAVANAAEMRGTGGMFLSYGEITSTNGTFTLDRFGPIDEIPLLSAAPTPAGTPADYIGRFTGLGPTLNWRNSNLGGDFTFIGPILESMHKVATTVAADGVLQIDSMGLAAMLRGTGPVEVDGLGQVTADNVVQLTLSDAYARFGGQRDQRQEVLGDVAEEVFRKLVTGDYPSLRPLATALIGAAAERRVILHMARADEQVSVATLGADGALPAEPSDVAMLSVQNFSGNKLDYYLDSEVRFSGERRPGAVGRLRADVTLTNTAPAGSRSPAYVFGPVNPNLKAGEYSGLVTLYLPTGAKLSATSGDLVAGPPGVVTEAGRTAVTFPVRVDAGQRVHVVLDLELPAASDDGYRFDVVPVSRVRPTTVAVDLVRGPGRRPLRAGGPLLRQLSLTDRAAG